MSTLLAWVKSRSASSRSLPPGRLALPAGIVIILFVRYHSRTMHKRKRQCGTGGEKPTEIVIFRRSDTAPGEEEKKWSTQFNLIGDVTVTRNNKKR